jgi:hypothetical protein
MPAALPPRPAPDRANFVKSLAPLFRDESGAALLAMMLASGGDVRIAPGPNGRNPYGAPVRPSRGEIWFASSTASPISPRGWAAAGAALPRAFSAAGAEDWFADLRRRILEPLAPQGADLVFCGSGTQAEYAALVCAQGLDGARPKKLLNLLIGPEETGRGARHAAAGKHFLDSAPFGRAAQGEAIAGWPENSIFLAGVPIRDESGAPREAADVDAIGAFFARHAAARGARALLHVLDCSKTGLAGFSRETAKQLKDEFPENISVVVDACQWRRPPERIRADLDAGFMVMISGSKFFGGPAFSGALLLPPDMMRALGRRREIFWPEGLAAHSAWLDWPPSLREKLSGPFGARANQGLGLRWEAALAEIELFGAQKPEIFPRAVALFRAEAAKNLARLPGLVLDPVSGEPTMLPIFSRSPEGAPLPADPIHRALRASGMHVGQKVALGEAEVLRLCLSAPQVNDFALRLAEGAEEAQAFAPLARDMAQLFDRWGALLEGA